MRVSLTEAMAEVLVMFSQTYVKKSPEDIAEAIPVWLAVMSDVDPLTPDILRSAALDVLRTVTDYWPKPAHLRSAALPHASAERERRFTLQHTPKRALPEGKPLTKERRDEILAGMKPGPRALLQALEADESSNLVIRRELPQRIDTL